MKTALLLSLMLLLHAASPDCVRANPETKTAPASKTVLQVHPQNRRYFTNGKTNQHGTLNAIYLTGSHTWPALIDRGPADPPASFEFDRYLDLLQTNHHNFIRLWTRHVSWYHGYGQGELHADPFPWPRTGPGAALDGKPRFDLTKFNDAYFQRLRSRVVAARGRGIYVGVMLFGGNYECAGGWRGNPFHAQNNRNGLNGDTNGDGEGFESHTLAVAAISRIQEAYVRKVIDVLNDLDNVLFEISNEGHSSSYDWQAYLVRFIREYESGKPNQHLVGMTALYVDDHRKGNDLLLASPADWISPQTDAAAVLNLPAASGKKISIIDSDHWFVRELYQNPELGRAWVWKSFCRGHHTLLMEHLPPLSFVDKDYPLSLDDPGYTASRKAMGDTRRFAERMNLAAMTPRTDVANSAFCLANPGVEYLVYAADGRDITLQLSAGTYRFEWFDPQGVSAVNRGTFRADGGTKQVANPFQGEAVLYLRAK